MFRIQSHVCFKYTRVRPVVESGMEVESAKKDPNICIVGY
jgi:hypothetical protein